MANPLLAQAFTTALRTGIATKGRLDRNVETLLALLNLPSRADVRQLLTKLEVIQGSLVNLNIKLDRLLAKRAGSQRRRSRARAPGPSTPPAE